MFDAFPPIPEVLSPLMQIALYAALGFLLLAFVLLRLRRGFLMHFALLLSFICIFMLGIAGHSYFVPFIIPYPFLGSYLLHCYASLLAKDQLNAEWSMLMSDFEAVPVDPNDFPDLDHEFYDEQTRFLEENGFQKLRDVDLRHLSRAFPFIRTFTRVFLHRDHEIIAFVSQCKAKVTIVPLFLVFSADHRCVEFATEFVDGMFLSTNNTKGINEMNVEGIIVDYHPQDFPIEKLLECHHENIDRVCEERGVDARLCTTESDVHAGGARQHVLIRQDRLKKGGGSIEWNLRESAKSTGPDDGLSYSKEYLKQAQQRAEKERRQQEGGEFI